MELSTRISSSSPICIRKDILTKVPPRKSEISVPSFTRVRSRSIASGGLMSIFWPSMVERDVAAAPIIWFMASEMALR